MIHHKQSTILLTILLSVTLLSVTGCIQKKELPIKRTAQQQTRPKEHLGAKVIPYTQPQQVVQHTQPQQTIQYTQPQETVQYSEEITPIYQEIEKDEDEEGCTDEVITSNCQREPTPDTSVNSSYTQNNSEGIVHTLTSVQGQNIKIGERSNGFTFPNHIGKVIILEMFGKTCPHCIKEIPTLKRLKRQYGSGLEVIAIHAQGAMSPSEAKRFIRQHRINYPLTDGSRAGDLLNFIQNRYSWTGVLPFTMVVKEGQVEGSFAGEAPYNELNEVISTLF